MSNIIELIIKSKMYKSKKEKLVVFDDFKLRVNQGDMIAIMGESGAGKTTLLNIIGLLDDQYDGKYELFEKDTLKFDTIKKSRIRNENIGFVLQESALIDTLTIKENIELPYVYNHSSPGQMTEELAHLLKISDILNKKPTECSGGQKSRACFARAIILKPDLILADEPTASLDDENKNIIINILSDLNQRFGVTVLTVTHDINVANKHDKIIKLK